MKQIPYKRIMVALDLSTIDETLISYSLWFAHSVKTKKIYFIYCAPELREINEDIDKSDEEKKIQKQISKVLEKNPSFKSLTYKIIVDPIKPLVGLLYWRDAKKIDLLMVGKKKRAIGSGIFAKQFVRLSKCSVLFIPENAKMVMDHILVPIDFSKNSERITQQSIDLKSDFGHPEISCLNIYQIFSNNYTAQKLDLPTNTRKKSIAEKYKEFMRPFLRKDASIKSIFSPGNEFETTEKVLKAANDLDTDLIIIGAIGHSKIPSLTVGSTAEKMMMMDCSVPLLIVQNQHSC